MPTIREWKRTASCVAIFVVAVGVASTASAQAATLVTESPDPAPENVFELTLSSMPEPTPAFKHRLLPVERKSGDAAANYLRAVVLHMDGVARYNDRRDADEGSLTYEEAVLELLDCPLEELDLARAKELLQVARLEDMTEDLELASTRTACDWGYRLSERKNIIAMLLPELQELRSMARTLALHVRVCVHEGDYDEAVRSARLGFAMSHHMGESPVLITALVGQAISGMMTERLLEMAQQPDAPNLYWSLTALPDPLVDIRNAAIAEGRMIPSLFTPELEGVESSDRSAEYWNVTMTNAIVRIADLSGKGGSPGKLGPEAFAAAIGIAAYPLAKKALIEHYGYDEAEVDAMPTGRVIGIYFKRVADRVDSDHLKAFEVDDAKQYTNVDTDWRPDRYDPVEQFAAAFYPALGHCRTAMLKNECRVATLRVIEAIRLHGAANDGELPTTLDEVDKIVPVPTNPLTGEPFMYHIEDGRGVLEVMSFDDRGDYPKRYIIQFAK